MKTMVIRSRNALSNPLPNTPVLPSYDPSLMASYDASSMDISGATLTKWRNKQGALGSQADLVTAKAQFPINVIDGAAVFLGGGSESYMDSSVFANKVTIGKATFITRIRFGDDADILNCTIFSSLDSNSYASVRRRTDSGTPKTFDVFLTNSPGAVQTKLAVEKQVWVDVALVIDGDSSRFYINDQVENISLGTNTTYMPSLRLGANQSGTSRLNGRISKFQFYNRALSLDELKEIRAAM